MITVFFCQFMGITNLLCIIWWLSFSSGKQYLVINVLKSCFCIHSFGIDQGSIIRCVALHACSTIETESECGASSHDACWVSRELIRARFLFLSNGQRGDGKITNTGKPICTHVFVYVILVGKNSQADRYGYYVTWTVGAVSCWRVKQYLPSLTAVSVVWCGRPVNTWTAGAPPQCRHTFPHYPGLNCTPAMIPLDLLATPEDKGVDKLRKSGQLNGNAAGESSKEKQLTKTEKQSVDTLLQKHPCVSLRHVNDDTPFCPLGVLCMLAKAALHSSPCGHQTTRLHLCCTMVQCIF